MYGVCTAYMYMYLFKLSEKYYLPVFIYAVLVFFRHGQLGISEDLLVCSHPRLVKTLRSNKVKRIECGEEHTVALTEVNLPAF